MELHSPVSGFFFFKWLYGTTSFVLGIVFLAQGRLFGSIDGCTVGGVFLEESLLSLCFSSWRGLLLWVNDGRCC